MKTIFKLFILIALFTSVKPISAMAQNRSSTVCSAYTQCFAYDPYGRRFPNGTISCKVYGNTYGGGGSENRCSWYVVPGQSVQCAGFIQMVDYSGRYYYAWQEYNYSCP